MTIYRLPRSLLSVSNSGIGASTKILATAAYLALGALASMAQEATPTRPLQLNTAEIKGLTVSKNERGTLGGHVTAMTLRSTTLTDLDAQARLDVEKGNGDTLRESLTSVRDFFVAEKRWPKGVRMTLAFENSDHPHDGRSFSLGAALLVDAMQTGAQIDGQVGATGQLTSTGRIAPVRGVVRKLEAAIAAGLEIIVIPADNSEVVADMLVLDGPGSLCHSQIIGVECFEHARQVATSGRNDDVASALALFQRLAGAIRERSAEPDKISDLLAHPKVNQALAQILTTIPGHLSTRYLSLAANGEAPNVLSLEGSTRAIDRIWPRILGNSSDSEEQSDSLRTAVRDLEAVAPLLDPITARYSDSVQDYATLLTEFAAGKPGSEVKQQRLRKAGSRIDTERRYLQQKLRERWAGKGS